MKIIAKSLLLLLVVMFASPPGHSLSVQQKQFASNVTFAANLESQWYEIKNYTYIDFTVLATAGDGTLVVEYASDADKLSAIEDSVGAAFDTSGPTSLFGAGMTKAYVRLKLTCVTPPCTLSGWFVAKGQMP